MKEQLKTAIRILAAAGALLAGTATGYAQAVYCTNCSSEVTQLLNLARLADQLATQGNILQTNTNQFQNMTQNTTPYSSLQWSNGAANLQSVNSTLANGSALSFANSGLTGQFGQQYGTYDSYLNTTSGSAAFAAKYQQWSTNTNASVLSTLQAGNLQSSQITGSEQASINALKAQTGSAAGNLQALQTIAQVGILNVQQLQALRQLILTDTSLHANAIQTQADTGSAQQAAWRTFLNTQTNIPTSGGQRF
jgi:P-type conjugative transfer protein TrbJ